VERGRDESTRRARAPGALIASDQDSITFKWKDYRIEGPDRYKRMTLAADEFIRRFLIHVLPKGFHRIRHYGLSAKTSAPTTSRVLANCSLGQSPKANPPMPMLPITTSRQPASENLHRSGLFFLFRTCPFA
jgi:Putative transposase